MIKTITGLLIIFASYSFAENNHNVLKQPGNTVDNPVPQIDFKSNGYTKIEGSVIGVETGTIGKLTAVRLHRGNRGDKNQQNNIFLVRQGQAKTLLEAKKICDNLVPLGNWGLLNGESTMLALMLGNPENMISSFTVPGNLEKNVYNFWGEIPKGQEPKTKDTFFSMADGEGVGVQSGSYLEMINSLRQQLASVRDNKVKKHLQKIYDQYKDGLPVVCMSGSLNDK